RGGDRGAIGHGARAGRLGSAGLPVLAAPATGGAGQSAAFGSRQAPGAQARVVTARAFHQQTQSAISSPRPRPPGCHPRENGDLCLVSTRGNGGSHFRGNDPVKGRKALRYKRETL